MNQKKQMRLELAQVDAALESITSDSINVGLIICPCGHYVGSHYRNGVRGCRVLALDTHNYCDCDEDHDLLEGLYLTGVEIAAREAAEEEKRRIIQKYKYGIEVSREKEPQS